VLAELTIELDRVDRSEEALEVLRRSEPWLVEVIRARLGQSVFVAEALLPFANAATRANDAALAERLRREAVRLLTLDRTEIETSHLLAPVAARVIRAIGDEASARWLAGLKGDARLGLDFDELERLRTADDPAWETLFDSLEERVENLGPSYQAHAATVLRRCGLPRAAFRHWLRTPRHLDADLLIALWREELEKPYQDLIDHVRRAWINGMSDWSGVGVAVELAIARAEAGDAEGARLSAQWARDLAEANAAEEEDAECAIWSLSHLLPLEMRLGEEARAREVLSRCRTILAAQPARSKIRSTTLLSLSDDCREAGFYDLALEFASMEKDEKARFLLQKQVARASRSLSIARGILDSLSEPLQRLDLILSVSRVLHSASGA
jgi:hypothetical protein